MTDLAVVTVGLRKVLRAQRGRRTAVAGLDLEVPLGGVHAMLGAPGSGRSEVLRLLLGLSSPTAGTITVLGAAVPRGLPSVIGRIGALVEEPTFSAGLSGRRNLLLLARAGGLDRERARARVGVVLERLGLSSAAAHRYAGYSVGERQRLALAAALLKDPDLLLLDDPTSDLDPAGSSDVLELLGERGTGHGDGHGDGGRTVLFTTDDPDLVRVACDSVSVLDEGRLLASGTAAEVVGDHRASTRVRVAEPERGEQLLVAAGYTVTRPDPGGRDLLVTGHDHPEEVTRLLAGHEVYVEELAVQRPDLASLLADMRDHATTRTAS